MARLFFWNATITLVGLLLVELIFGSWFKASHLESLNLLQNVDLTFNAETLYGDEGKVVHYKRDRYGLRGHYANPAAVDILTVGGSTTDQRFVSEDWTWQDVLSRSFGAAGRPVTVVNAGVDGQSTYGHIRDFELWFPQIPGLKPKLVIIYVGINDFYKDVDYFSDDFALPAGVNKLWEAVQARSALYHLARTATGVFQAEMVYQAGHRRLRYEQLTWANAPLRNDHAKLTAKRLDAYAERLRRLDGFIQKMGAKAVYVTQTRSDYYTKDHVVYGNAYAQDYDGVKINYVDRYYMDRILNDRTMAVCAERGGTCLDLAKDLALERQDFYDGAHNTPTGTAKIGHYLFDKLRTTTF